MPIVVEEVKRTAGGSLDFKTMALKEQEQIMPIVVEEVKRTAGGSLDFKTMVLKDQEQIMPMMVEEVARTEISVDFKTMVDSRNMVHYLRSM